MKMEHHFALPLRALPHGDRLEDANADTALVAVDTDVTVYEEAAKAAALAINCHDELVEALQGTLRIVEEIAKVIKPLQADPALAHAQDILKKAKGE